jgi:hypothetical protein
VGLPTTLEDTTMMQLAACSDYEDSLVLVNHLVTLIFESVTLTAERSVGDNANIA